MAVSLISLPDWVVFRLSKSRNVPRLLLASSGVTLTFLLRPFSNTIETTLLAFVLYFVDLITSSRCPRLLHVAALGCIIALGIWTRITFLAFALPAVVATLWTILQTAQSRPRVLFSRAALLAISSLLSAALFILADSIYFARTFVVTPYNSAAYNLLQSNLAKHGLHPRWLHFFVNLPIICGPLLPLLVLAIKPSHVSNSPTSSLMRKGEFFLLIFGRSLNVASYIPENNSLYCHFTRTRRYPLASGASRTSLSGTIDSTSSPTRWRRIKDGPSPTCTPWF
jgi:hypothetical protein